MQGPPPQGGAALAVYPDLGATVYPDGAGLADELPDLYASLFCNAAWFRAYDGVPRPRACVLELPRHVVLFATRGDTIEILNKAFPIAPADVERVCTALFRAVPEARRIHVEVLFPPARLHVPHRVLYWADDLVVDLPPTVALYNASLGKRTRKNLRNYENRLRRESTRVTTEVVRPGERTGEFVALFLLWHLARSAARGITSVYVSKPEQRAQLTELVEALGEVQLTTIGGKPAAIEFLFFVGADATVYAGAFDAHYEDVHLGLLSTYWAICETVRHDSRRCHLLWATAYYKSLLGARPHRATRLSVFRSQAARLHSLDEAAEVTRRRLKRGKEYYWRSRRAARVAFDVLMRRARTVRSVGRGGQ